MRTKTSSNVRLRFRAADSPLTGTIPYRIGACTYRALLVAAAIVASARSRSKLPSSRRKLLGMSLQISPNLLTFQECCASHLAIPRKVRVRRLLFSWQLRSHDQ